MKDYHLLGVDDASIAADSGWRAVDKRRVAELVETFLAGEYGNNILRKPSVFHDAGGKPRAAGDGRAKLCDGKHTFAALRELKELFAEDEAADEQQQSRTWSTLLVDALKNGVAVSLVEYKDDRKHLAHQVLAHDADSNKYKPTTIKSLIETVEQYKLEQPGGDLKAMQAAMNADYGSSKRTFVHRMCQCAAHLPGTVVELLQEPSR